jgi:hypothetical protein
LLVPGREWGVIILVLVHPRCDRSDSREQLAEGKWIREIRMDGRIMHTKITGGY